MNTPEFYRVDSRNLTVRELFRWFGLSASFWKRLMRKLSDQTIGSAFWPHPANTKLLEQLPDDDVAALVSKLVEDVRPERFGPPVYIAHPSLTAATVGYGANMVSDDRTTFAAAAAAKSTRRAHAKIASVFTCMSRMSEGLYLATTNAPPRIPQSPSIRTERLLGASVHDVVERHRRRIAGKKLDLYDPSPAKLFEEVVALAGLATNYLLRRGFLKPMTPAEIAEVRRRGPPQQQ